MAHRSVEQKLFEPLLNVGVETIRGAYGCFVGSLLRVPTSARKIIKKETFLQKKLGEYKTEKDKAVGLVLGEIAGIGLDIYALYGIAEATKHRNYLPLFGVIATNLTSLGFELGRRKSP